MTTREKLIAMFSTDGLTTSTTASRDGAERTADAILAIMDPELREAYMDGWKDQPLLPTEKDAEAHSLMIWPDKEA